MHKENSFAKNTAILLVSMIITKLIGAVLKIPLTNILGGVGMGYYSTAFSIFTPVYAVLSAGIPTVVTTLVAQNASRRCYRNVKQLKRCSLIIAAVSGAFGSVFLFALAEPFASFFAASPQSSAAVAAIAPSVLFCCVAAAYKGYFEGLSDMVPTAGSQIVEAAVKALFGLSLAYAAIQIGVGRGFSYEEVLPYSAAAAIAGISLGELCGTLFLMLCSKSRSDGITAEELKRSPCPLGKRKTARSVILSALPISLGAAAGSLSSFIDMMTVPSGIMIAAGKAPDYFTARYGVADFAEFGTLVYGSYTGIVLTLFMLVTGVTALLGKSALPKISAQCGCSDRRPLTARIETLFAGIFAVGFPMCAGLSLFSREILGILYPSRTLEAAVSAEPLMIISAAGIFVAAAGGLFAVFQALGLPKVPVKLTLLAVAVKYALNLTLTAAPETAVNAAAISSSVSYAAVTAIGWLVLRRKARISLNLPLLALKPLCAVTGAVAAGYAAHKLTAGYGEAISLVSGAAAFGTVYLCVMAAAYKKLIISRLKSRGKVDFSRKG